MIFAGPYARWHRFNWWVSECAESLQWCLSESFMTPHQATWDSPGKNTGVGCCFLLQGVFPTQGLNPHPRLLYWQAHSLPLVPPRKLYFSWQRSCKLKLCVPPQQVYSKHYYNTNSTRKITSALFPVDREQLNIVMRPTTTQRKAAPTISNRWCWYG